MRRLLHLARRFFQSVRSRPLEPAEQDLIATWLQGPEAELFWRQQRIDRRHAFDAAGHVSAARPERTDLTRAALLHDVGKADSSLSIPGRVIASALDLIGIPVRGRYRAYLDHGAIGAAHLTLIEADPIAVAFAAGHPGPCPPGVDPGDWALLREADGE